MILIKSDSEAPLGGHCIESMETGGNRSFLYSFLFPFSFVIFCHSLFCLVFYYSLPERDVSFLSSIIL